jgi:hypothetical protein
MPGRPFVDRYIVLALAGRSTIRSWAPAQAAMRALFAGLLAAAVAVPHLAGNGFDFPAVEHGLSLLPFALLMALPLLGVPPGRTAAGLLALLLPVASLVLTAPQRQWAIFLVYAALAYAVVRLLRTARRPEQAHGETSAARGWLPISWLLVGIAVLLALHVAWAAGSHTTTDAGDGTVRGALRLLHGGSVYGQGALAHEDTYGPLTYEAYAPFALLFGLHTASHVASLFYDLCTAGLLVALGRRLRCWRTGLTLAFCWLAFPLTFYAEVFGFTDPLVAALLVAGLLLSTSTAGLASAAAAAGWVKLSPFALIPLTLASRLRRSPRRIPATLLFAGSACAVSALVLAPVLIHSHPSAIVSRTLGYQIGRAPADSLWSSLQGVYAEHQPWLGTLSRVAHGLVLAVAGGLALLAPLALRRNDAVGLAALSAAILGAIVAADGYFSYNYLLWVAAPMLVCIVLPDGPARAGTAAGRIRADDRSRLVIIDTTSPVA